MRLSETAYYSDFYVYPIVILGLTVCAVVRAGIAEALTWLGALLAGLALWTLLEYSMHRIVFHRMAFFIPMHGEHHHAPLAHVGTPTWMSLSVLLGVFFLPFWFGFGFTRACGLTAGMMAGYLCYGALHHLIHHPRYRLPLLGRLRTWHLRHHYSAVPGNFGVTGVLWDHVFRTVLPVRGTGRG
jgi:sterol desaturase/sphingolipid hydroxylase (fatty acid hydroxylase superfamily)